MMRCVSVRTFNAARRFSVWARVSRSSVCNSAGRRAFGTLSLPHPLTASSASLPSSSLYSSSLVSHTTRGFAVKSSAKNKSPSISLEDLMEAYAIDLSEHDMNMEAYVDTFRTALSTLKDGTPSPDIFDHLKVKCYGAEDTPLPSVAQVSSLGATKLQVTVFDPSVLKDVSHAIAGCGMDLNPQVQGEKLIVDFPKSTKESRMDLFTKAKKLAETTKSNVRSIRQKAMNELKKAKAPKDEENETKTVVQVLTDNYSAEIATLLKDKENELQ